MKYLASASVVICLVLFGWTVWYDRSLKVGDPIGHSNLKECKRIEPGASEVELLRRLGAPEKTAAVGGVRRLEFHTLRAASAPISADVDPATGKVLELRCLCDGFPTWTMPR